MANEQTAIKQGYLHQWNNEDGAKKSVWQPLFFVLHGPSMKNAARLDWYDTQEQFLLSPGKRKALFIEEIKDCKQISYNQESVQIYGSSAKYLLMIQTYRTAAKIYVLKCSSQDLLTEWHDHLNDLLQHVHTMSKAIRASIPDKLFNSDDIYNPNVFGSSSFEVQVDDTSAAVRCELLGIYRLLLSQQHITLADPDTGNPVITWMYKQIRRFGYCDRSFTIEGGSKCGIGQGLFIFNTDRGNELKKAIDDRLQLCRNLAEQDYTYISFSKPKESMMPDVGGKKSLAKSKSNSIDKPPPPGKPPINKTEQNRIVGLSHPSSQSLQKQPKMSEVLSMLPQQNIPSQEDEIYGYKHLDLKGTASKTNLPPALENLYGEHLCQQIKNSK